MKTHFRGGVGLLVFLLLNCYSASWADQGKVSGYFFGDYYDVFQSHDEALNDRNGFQFRRVYFTYDKGLSDEFAVRFRLEMNSPSFPGRVINGEPSANAKLEPFIKHGYLKWSKTNWPTTVYFGLSGTPTWSVIEKVWGYRPVAKTLLDLQRLGSSADFGIAVQGSIDAAKKLSYYAMVGNGNSTSAENDDSKKTYLSMTARPVEGVIAEAYVDFDNRNDSKNRYTLQGFLAYQQEDFRVGVQIAHQTREQSKDADDLKLLGLSLFATAQLIKKKVWVLGRFDRMFDPNPDGEKIAFTPFDATAKSNTIIAGIDWTPVEDVHIIPNLFLTFYDAPDAGKKPEADIMPRLTLYFLY